MEYQENQEYQKYQKEYQEKKKKKKIRAVFLVIVFCGVWGLLVNYYYDQKRQERYEAVKHGKELVASVGLIDCGNSTLNYNVPSGYVQSKENSTNISKMYIAEDTSRVLCVSMEEGNKKYTESDIDTLISNNMGSGYVKSAAAYGSNDFYIYTYSENGEWDKNEIKPVRVTRYVSVRGKYIISLTDIVYVEKNDEKDVSDLLNSISFYGTSS